jgi:hypothetical protein
MTLDVPPTRPDPAAHLETDPPYILRWRGLPPWLTIRFPQAPEIQTMYNMTHPVSAIRTRMRQEFERHRFINKLPVVDVLLFQSDADYQVGKETFPSEDRETGWLLRLRAPRWHAQLKPTDPRAQG